MAFKVAKKGRGNRKRGISADINVTPLVDVMLVLLVIFMATAPMLASGVPVDIPKSEAGPIHEDDQGPIEVVLNRTGQIFVGETPVDQARLLELLSAMTHNSPDRRIFLRADAGLDYGDVMRILGAMNAAGYRKVALITEQP